MNIDAAIQIASEAHEGQLDLTGVPYIRHPFRVMEAVAHHGEDAQVVAVLHDVLEDCDVEMESLGSGWVLYCESSVPFEKRGLTETQGDALLAITRFDGEVYADYIERVADDDLATIVKVADLKDNLSPERMAGIPENRRRGLAGRYWKSLVRLLHP